MVGMGFLVSQDLMAYLEGMDWMGYLGLMERPERPGWVESLGEMDTMESKARVEPEVLLDLRVNGGCLGHVDVRAKTE